MAKKDKGEKAKGKIPKKVAGVKLPKKVRKLGNQALKIARDPAVSETAAAALLAAAAAIREGKDPRGTFQAAVGAVAESGRDAKREAGRLSDVLKGVALDIARRSYEAWEESGRRAREAEPWAPHLETGAPKNGEQEGADAESAAPPSARKAAKKGRARAS